MPDKSYHGTKRAVKTVSPTRELKIMAHTVVEIHACQTKFIVLKEYARIVKEVLNQAHQWEIVSKL
jgi:hypothetical protein